MALSDKLGDSLLTVGMKRLLEIWNLKKTRTALIFVVPIQNIKLEALEPICQSSYSTFLFSQKVLFCCKIDDIYIYIYSVV